MKYENIMTAADELEWQSILDDERANKKRRAAFLAKLRQRAWRERNKFSTPSV